METKKILGLVILISGLIIISLTLYFSYNIFTAKSPAPQIFSSKGKEVVDKDEKSKTAQDPQEQINEMIGEQIKEMLPVGSLFDLLNLISWSIFAGILIFGGSRISYIGIKLMKKE